MNIYSFDLVLDADSLTTDDVDRIYANSADSSVSSQGARHVVSFDREAHGLEAAIVSAVADLKRAGFDVRTAEMSVANLAAASA